MMVMMIKILRELHKANTSQSPIKTETHTCRFYSKQNSPSIHMQSQLRLIFFALF